MKELKYRKNSKFEIKFTNVDEIKEGDNVVLKLNRDLSPLFYLDCEFTKFKNFFICGIFNDYQLQQIAPILKNYNECIVYFFDIDNFELFLQIEKKNNFVNSNVQFKNICPKWNISKDTTILFLNTKTGRKYGRQMNLNWFYWLNAEKESIDCQFINKNTVSKSCTEEEKQLLDQFYALPKSISKTISLIIPELHAEDYSSQPFIEEYWQESQIYHINNINKVCKELKEKYGVEKIELFVSHCFLRVDDISLFCYQENGKMCMNYQTFYDWHIEPPFRYLNFDFLTITNSTQNIDTYNQCDRNESNEFYKKEKNNYESRLEVIDVVEFFNI